MEITKYNSLHNCIKLLEPKGTEQDLSQFLSYSLNIFKNTIQNTIY